MSFSPPDFLSSLLCNFLCLEFVVISLFLTLLFGAHPFCSLRELNFGDMCEQISWHNQLFLVWHCDFLPPCPLCCVLINLGFLVLFY